MTTATTPTYTLRNRLTGAILFTLGGLGALLLTSTALTATTTVTALGSAALLVTDPHGRRIPATVTTALIAAATALATYLGA